MRKALCMIMAVMILASLVGCGTGDLGLDLSELDGLDIQIKTVPAGSASASDEEYEEAENEHGSFIDFIFGDERSDDVDKEENTDDVSDNHEENNSVEYQVPVPEEADNEYDSNYVNEVFSEANELFNRRQFQEAVDVLKRARMVSGLDAFDEAIESYSEYIPVNLLDMDYIKKTSYINVFKPGKAYVHDTDVNENNYRDYGVIYPNSGFLNSEVATSDDESCVSYYINQKYSTLTGRCFRQFYSLKIDSDKEYRGYIKIYGDGVLLYSSPEITKTTFDPIDFSVDVRGVRELKIVARGTWRFPDGGGCYDYYPIVGVTGLMLQK